MTSVSSHDGRDRARPSNWATHAVFDWTCSGPRRPWFSFAVLWYNQARPEERRKPPVSNGCRWRQLSRGLQRILSFAKVNLSRKSDSYDN